jgi:outer membrane protein TolC
MNRLMIYLIIPLTLLGSKSWASETILSLKEVWSDILEASLTHQAGEAQVHALQESLMRAENHWLPKVYFNAQSYKTNNPGTSFFGVIQQRALETGNFAVNSINNPSAEIYSQGSLGLDLPLYEGGMRASQVDMMNQFVQSGKKQNLQTKLDQFAIVSKYYGLIQSMNLKKDQLINLKQIIQKQLNGYQLGSKSNPVGYSGLLGMKSLLNRLQGLINQYEGQSLGYRKSLNEMGLKQKDWNTESLSTENYIKSFDLEKINLLLKSYKTEAMALNAHALSFSPKMEIAKFRPQIGTFAEGYVFNGSKNTANGYTVGVYLRWNLFDPNVQGSVKEAQFKSIAISKSSEAMAQQEQAEKTAMLENFDALRKNHALMLESERLLSEQTKTSQTLFRNGSINALQMTEVLNRRVDLISQLKDLESALIEISTGLITKTKYTNLNFEIQ